MQSWQDQSLPRSQGDLKKFTAREILAQLNVERREWLLNQLAYYRAKHKTNSDHQVWQEGVHPQSIPTDTIMLQKLKYLHNNPVKRGLVASSEHWRYSSAHEWLAGSAPPMRVDPWRQITSILMSANSTAVPERAIPTIFRFIDSIMAHTQIGWESWHAFGR